MKIRKISRNSYAQIISRNQNAISTLSRLSRVFEAWGMTEARVHADEKRMRVELRDRRLRERTVDAIVTARELVDLVPMVVR